MSGEKSCADATHADSYNAIIHRSMMRQAVGLSPACEERNREERHREMVWVLDRIATAIEAGNLAFTQTADRL